MADVDKIKWLNNAGLESDKANTKTLPTIDIINKISGEDLNQIRDVVNVLADVMNGTTAPPDAFPSGDSLFGDGAKTTTQSGAAFSKTESDNKYELKGAVGESKFGDGTSVSTQQTALNPTNNSNLLIENDVTSTDEADLGIGFKGTQTYGTNATGGQFYGFSATGDQSYGFSATGDQSYGESATGDQSYGESATGDISLGSSLHKDGDGKGVLIHAAKTATFESIIDSSNGTFDVNGDGSKIVKVYDAGTDSTGTAYESEFGAGEDGAFMKYTQTAVPGVVFNSVSIGARIINGVPQAHIISNTNGVDTPDRLVQLNELKKDNLLSILGYEEKVVYKKGARVFYENGVTPDATLWEADTLFRDGDTAVQSTSTMPVEGEVKSHAHHSGFRNTNDDASYIHGFRKVSSGSAANWNTAAAGTQELLGEAIGGTSNKAAGVSGQWYKAINDITMLVSTGGQG